jgi:hypothetical protein
MKKVRKISTPLSGKSFLSIRISSESFGMFLKFSKTFSYFLKISSQNSGIFLGFMRTFLYFPRMFLRFPRTPLFFPRIFFHFVRTSFARRFFEKTGAFMFV